MDRTYRGLGFDPTPGEPDAVTATIAQFIAAAEALAAFGPAVRRAGELTEDWRGPAADAFRAALAGSPGGLEERARTLRRAAEVLDDWAGVLTANRRSTEELDERAVRLRNRLEQANDQVQDRRNALDLASTGAAAASASADLTAVTTLVADLKSALDDVLAQARTLERDHLRAADAVADEFARLRGEDVPRRPGSERFLITVGDTLSRSSHTSTALAALLASRTAAAEPPPTGAAATLAEALRSGGPR